MKNPMRFIVLGIGLTLGVGADRVAARESLESAEGNKLDLRKGLQVYKSACAQCHATGQDGAPRLHDAAAWKDRSFQSFSVMDKHAEKGFLAMPPKGKRPALTRQEVANAVFYMTEQIRDKAAH